MYVLPSQGVKYSTAIMPTSQQSWPKLFYIVIRKRNCKKLFTLYQFNPQKTYPPSKPGDIHGISFAKNKHNNFLVTEENFKKSLTEGI